VEEDKKNLEEKKSFRIFHMRKLIVGEIKALFINNAFKFSLTERAKKVFICFIIAKMIDRQAVRSYISQT
jgi:hypothetical protein